MSKKKLDTSTITNELESSSFFKQAHERQEASVKKPERKKHKKAQAPVTRRQTRNEADKLAQEQARYQASTIEAIRKVVRVVGKEVAFVRLTPAEKQQLGDKVYSYKRQGIKTTENELLRIGLAFLLTDFDENGKESVLAQAIEALNS